MAITPEKLLKEMVVEYVGSQEIDRDLFSGSKPLKIKLGIDPTSPDIHLGHLVVFRKLRQFQQLGHHIYLVIGDFTASIGDPSGKNTARPVLTPEEIRNNMQTYIEQIGKIIDIQQTHIVYNSQWLGNMSFKNFLSYATLVSVNQLIEREDFALRLKDSQSVGLHELLYPVAQGIDSVELKADVEIGGIDQRLNLLMARDLQKKMGQVPEAVMMLQLLVGLDGEKKMSKSANNYIGITESPDQMFGKLMRIPDGKIDEYIVLLLGEESLRQIDSVNPREKKALMAQEIVSFIHGSDLGKEAHERFNKVFRDKEVDEQLIKKVISNQPLLPVWQAVVLAGETSRSEAQRLIEQGAVKINQLPVSDWQQLIDLRTRPINLQIGKYRFYELLFSERIDS